MPLRSSSDFYSEFGKQNRRLFGFSFVELLMVIAIMAIVFSLGMASYRDFSRRKQIEAAVNQVRSDLDFARQNALSGVKPQNSSCNSPNTLLAYVFVAQSGSYTIRSRCSGGTVDVRSGVSLPYGVTITSNILSDCTTPNAGNSIEFLPRGNGTNLPAGACFRIRFSLTGSGFTQDIIVDQSGSIR
ncbi:MAG: GspH/FimT family pseudopilin [Patescibacteria group bacterium]|nr:GspH/FimT family pseudopilin [Patescibacteria group bacterium]